MKVCLIKVFLGSSSRLMSLRHMIGARIQEENHVWETNGFFVELLIWEDFKSEYSGTSKQEEYDIYLVKKSDVIVTIFEDAVGEYTSHELDVAIEDHKQNIHCLVLPSKNKAAVVNDIKAKNLTHIDVNDHNHACDVVIDIIKKAIESIDEGKCEMKPLASVSYRFYATIPDDVMEYRSKLKDMFRSFDMVARENMDMHIILNPYRNPDLIADSIYYIGIFGNTAQNIDVNEFNQSLNHLADESSPRKEMAIYQNKASKKSGRMDIRKNFPAIGNILTERQIFTIGLRNVETVRMNLLMWCLRIKNSIAIFEELDNFKVEGKSLLYNDVNICHVEAIGDNAISSLVNDCDSIMQKIKNDNIHDDEKRDLRLAYINKNAELKKRLVITIDSLLYNGRVPDDETENLTDELENIESALKMDSDIIDLGLAVYEKKWRDNLSSLKGLRQNLESKVSDNESIQEKLLSCQKLILSVKEQLFRHKLIDVYEYLNEQIHTVGIIDTYILHPNRMLLRYRDSLYKGVVNTADGVNITSFEVEIIRMNYANALAREMRSKEAESEYLKIIANIQNVRYNIPDARSAICHIYVTIINHLADMNYVNPKIPLVLDNFKKTIDLWNEKSFQCVIEQALYALCRLKSLPLYKCNQIEIIDEAEKMYNKVAAAYMLKPTDKFYNEILCYLPGLIASYYIDWQFSPDVLILKIVKYLGYQLYNAEKLKDTDYLSYIFYSGAAYHNLGFAKSMINDFQYLKEAIDDYQRALTFRREMFLITKNQSNNCEIAQTLVNIGGLLLAIRQCFPSKVESDSPVPYAREAMDIYKQHVNADIESETNYYKAVQLYASSIYCLNLYDEANESRDNVIAMLKLCYIWNNQHKGNSYYEKFMEVSGSILVNEKKIR